MVKAIASGCYAALSTFFIECFLVLILLLRVSDHFGWHKGAFALDLPGWWAVALVAGLVGAMDFFYELEKSSHQARVRGHDGEHCYENLRMEVANLGQEIDDLGDEIHRLRKKLPVCRFPKNKPEPAAPPSDASKDTIDLSKQL